MKPGGIKHPGRWLWLFLLVPVALGLTRLHFDVEVFDLLPNDLPSVQGLRTYQQQFANARQLLITVQAPGAEQAENAARAISEQLRLQTNLVAGVTWEPPWLEHPEQTAELIAYLWLNQPPAEYQQLAQRLAPDKLSENLAAVRERLATSLSPEEIARSSYDPFGLTRLPESASAAAPAFGQGQDLFRSADGKFRIVFVQASSELRTYKECDRWLRTLKPLAEAAAAGAGRKSGDIKLGFTGRPAFVAEVATGMERDITISVGGTAVIIALLFWLAHRRIKPMLWLLTLLALILACTLALGGLIFGAINVVSMGFAAILLGLAVDYAVVHYQEALAHPSLTIPQIRREIAPSIFWAAVTTISAFTVLNLGGLPGLGQLGSLVGLGVALSACIMIFEFLPPLFPDRREPKKQTMDASAPETLPSAAKIAGRFRGAYAWPVTFLLSAFVLVFLTVRGGPRIDPTADPLRPKNSPAYAALDQVQALLNQKREPLWLIIKGSTVADVARTLAEVQPVLERAVSNHVLAGFTLPTQLWPQPQNQSENRPLALSLAGERAALRQAASSNGFAPASLALTERILDTWQRAGATAGVFWPTNEMSQWILDKLVARTPTNYFALGLINSAPGKSSRTEVSRLADKLPRKNVWLSGWQLLGGEIFGRVQRNIWKVVMPMICLVLLSLWLAFRRWLEILLSLSALLLGGLCLLTLMRLAGWSWNLLNLMAIPLMLGTGVDYGIFMQLALRRYGGDLTMAYNSVGRALLLCGGTAIAGFGSLAVSSNAGMASLGQVCAVGIACNMLIAIFLTPFWWSKLQRRVHPNSAVRGGDGSSSLAVQTGEGDKSGPHSHSDLSPRPSLVSRPSDFGSDSLASPSILYRSSIWRMGLAVVGYLPASLCEALARLSAQAYWLFAWRRRAVLVRNLLPATSGETRVAKKKARDLVHQFALKLLDLWRYEAGLPIDHLLGATSGWEHFEHAQAKRCGVLLLTPHLGNWEFGGPALSRKGVALQVVTLAEPGAGFTELRRAGRARSNIETVVVRNDPFAFVEIIRRLESGATVALLVDRPPTPTAVEVELFGKPFAASIAAAELARASGCILLPVYLPRRGDVYEAHILPEIPYDRAALRNPVARRELTQEIMQIFEPVIRQHLDQWFHFVPVY